MFCMMFVNVLYDDCKLLEKNLCSCMVCVCTLCFQFYFLLPFCHDSVFLVC